MKTSPTFIQWWKEFRAVLPLWVGAMVALGLYSLSNSVGNDHNFWQTVIFMVGSVVVCSLVYTREFQDHTLIWQYLQPIDRLKVPGRKFVVAVVLQVVFFAWYLLFSRSNWLGSEYVYEYGLLISVLAVGSCCLWAVLIRNPINTIVVSFLVPVVLSMVLAPQLESIAERVAAPPGLGVANSHSLFLKMWSGAMVVYAFTCFGLGILLWRRMQFVGEINSVSRLDTGVMTRLFGDKHYRLRPLWLSLMRKELGLIRFIFWIFAASLFVAVVFVVVDLILTHMVTIAQSKLPAGKLLPEFAGIVFWQSSVRIVAKSIFVLLLSLVPLLCGALTFTEETYLRTRAWELCQPIRSHSQWLVKLVTSLGVSIALGLVMPGLVVYLFQKFHLAGIDEQQFDPARVLQVIPLHLMLFGLAAWCATWSRTTVMAIMKAFLAVTLFVGLIGEFASAAYYQSAQYRTGFELPDWRVVAIMVALFAFVAAWLNFRMLHVPTRRWVWQSAGLGLLVLAAFSPYLIDRFMFGL